MCPIFGGVSAGTDISDADAVVADVKATDTFYAVSGAIFGIVGNLAAMPPVADATVAMFQSSIAKGTFNINSYSINDNVTGAPAYASNINEYAQVNYGQIVKIDKWRHFGQAINNGTGIWKIQYWNLTTQAWTDWVTGIVVSKSATWSDFSNGTEVITTAIRLVCTAVDGAEGYSIIGELEVIE